MRKISIITVNLNNAAGLLKTIASVTGQQDCDIELIVIDGGSDDGSVSVIQQQAQHISHWISEKDKGIYHAQNKGVLKATGDYCLFLNSGDVLAGPTVLKQLLAASDDKDIVYGDLITVDRDGKQAHQKSGETPDVVFFMLSTLWHPTALIRRVLFDNFGLYNDTFKITGDYEFFIRAILRYNASVKHVPVEVCVFDLGGISNSPAMKELEQVERKKSWTLNFSEAAIANFEAHTRLLRSREYRLGRMVQKILNPFLK